jgi:hypothetical protein
MLFEACEQSGHGPLFCKPCLCSLCDIQHLSNKASHTKNLHVGVALVLCSSFDARTLDWPNKNTLYADDLEYCWFADHFHTNLFGTFSCKEKFWRHDQMETY